MDTVTQKLYRKHILESPLIFTTVLSDPGIKQFFNKIDTALNTQGYKTINSVSKLPCFSIINYCLASYRADANGSTPITGFNYDLGKRTTFQIEPCIIAHVVVGGDHEPTVVCRQKYDACSPGVVNISEDTDATNSTGPILTYRFAASITLYRIINAFLYPAHPLSECDWLGMPTDTLLARSCTGLYESEGTGYHILDEVVRCEYTDHVTNKDNCGQNDIAYILYNPNRVNQRRRRDFCRLIYDSLSVFPKRAPFVEKPCASMILYGLQVYSRRHTSPVVGFDHELWVQCTAYYWRYVNATNNNALYTQGLIFTAHTNTSTLFAPNSPSPSVTTHLPIHLITPGNILTRFNKIAIQGTPQMAVD